MFGLGDNPTNKSWKVKFTDLEKNDKNTVSALKPNFLFCVFLLTFMSFSQIHYQVACQKSTMKNSNESKSVKKNQNLK